MWKEKIIKVVIVDDSRLVRKILRDALTSDKSIVVVGEASNGEEAVDLTLKLKPDVVLMDVVMPKMDGITAIKEIMKKRPTPIIVFSSITQEGSKAAIDALEAGALEVLAKPGGVPIFRDLGDLKKELVKKVKVLARIGPAKLALRNQLCMHYGDEYQYVMKEISYEKPLCGVILASSTGGPQTLMNIVPKISPKLKMALLIVQHMPPLFTRSLAERLNAVSPIEIKEAEDGDEVTAKRGYVAPGGYHMLVREKRGKIIIELDRGPKVHGLRPAADITMTLAAEVWRSRTVGVVLTGMGEDGLEGAYAIKKYGGVVIVQDESTSIVWGMPQAVVKHGLADYVLPLHKISLYINRIVMRKLGLR